jgi:IPTL-CTERM motif
MTRLASTVAVLLLTTGTAYGQGEPVSFYVVASDSGVLIAAEDNPGFVLTDIATTVDMGTLRLTTSGPIESTAATKLAYRTGLDPVLHLNSGVVFDAGEPIYMFNGFVGNVQLTLTGYIPSPSASVPTVSQWGLLLMVMVLLIGGTTIFARRKVATA